jgi:hypothetical protein
MIRPNFSSMDVLAVMIFVITPGAVGYFIFEKYFGLGLLAVNLWLGYVVVSSIFSFRLNLEDSSKHSVTLRMALLCRDVDYGLDHYDICRDRHDWLDYRIYDKDITLSFSPSIGMRVFGHKIIAIDVAAIDYSQRVFCLVECDFKEKEWFHSEHENIYKEHLIRDGWKEIGVIGQPYVRQYHKDMMTNLIRS